MEERPTGETQAGPRDETRQRLIREDAAFRRLVKKHEEYDTRLQSLQSRKYLSDEEKIEEVTLKKLKLALKDQMESILRQAVNG